MHFVTSVHPTRHRVTLANFLQGFGLSASQYNSASLIARTVQAENPSGMTLAFTGHSLGGGLAATAGAITGADTKTFNAAGVSKNTLKRFGVSKSKYSNITNHISRGDILTFYQTGSGALGWSMPDAIGKQQYSGNLLYWLVAGGVVGIERHSAY